MLEIGSVVEGNYKILSEIGRGGMSVVYLALNERANKTWAIKEARKDGNNGAEIVTQGLIAETEILKKLNHPYLPSIIDVIDREDTLLIIMDYIEGRNLLSVLSHNGPQDQNQVIKWAMQLCDVLGYLHTREPAIIYRDLKPQNVMLKPNGDIALLDFGTAREFKETSHGDTTWLGTRGYAAPEQFGGRGQTDPRTDIYNLGATMYHLLTGYSPADTNFVIYPLRVLNPAFEGTGIEKIVAKCCEPDPAARFQNCAELMYALEHVHDEDDVARIARNRKWKQFIAASVIALVGLLGSFAFLITGNRATNSNYDMQIAEAENLQGNLKEAVRYYEKAIRIKPGDPRAYESLRVTVEKNDGERRITNEEQAILFSVFSPETINRFASSGGREYAEFCYHMGIDYFLLYDEGDLEKKLNESKKWMQRVTSDQKLLNMLGTHEKDVAEAIYDISQLKLQDDINAGEDVRAMWTKLVEMTNDNNIEKLGDSLYKIKMYNMVIDMIGSPQASIFKNKGIGQSDMENQLSKMQSGLQMIKSDTNDEAMLSLIDAYLENIEKAQAVVKSTFDSKG